MITKSHNRKGAHVRQKSAEMDSTKADYVPFGDEWRKEMMKLTKPQLVDLLRSACMVAGNAKEIARAATEAAWHKVNRRIISFDSFKEAIEPIILNAIHASNAEEYPV